MTNMTCLHSCRWEVAKPTRYFYTGMLVVVPDMSALCCALGRAWQNFSKAVVCEQSANKCCRFVKRSVHEAKKSMRHSTLFTPVH